MLAADPDELVACVALKLEVGGKMIKSYVSTLLAAFLAVAQVSHAQDEMDDIFSQLDAGSNAGGQAAEVEAAAAAEVQQAPSLSDDEMLSRLYKKGVKQYKAGNYDDAIAAFDAMLAIDKYNNKATTYRERASRRISAKELNKAEASREQALAEVHAAWNPKPKVLGNIDVSDATDEADPNQQAIEQTIERLKAIAIPRLDFSDASIEEVVLFLTEASRQLDRSGKGVNIMLIGMKSEVGGASVTTAITDINLYNALRLIAEMASLQFEVRPNAVAIMPANYVSIAEMVMRSYDIIPEIGVDLESFSGDAGGGVDDLFGDAPAAATTGPVDVAGFFSIVDFPEGSSAVYQPRFHKLFIKNTPKNLAGIESVLTDLAEEAIRRRSQQVEIETKFVEFNEGALEELGFDWNVYGSGTIASLGLDGRDVLLDPGVGATPGFPTSAIDPLTGQEILSDTYASGGRPGQNVFGSTHRNNSSAFDTVATGLLSAMGGTPASMAFGNGDIDLKITAMEQEGTADVLSAPRVTTKSGSEAIIRVAETHRYPQDYDVETGQRTAPVVKPQDWEDVDLGVSLRVTPVVDSESNTIELDLQPEIIRFIDFDEYIVGYNSQRFLDPDSVAPVNPGLTVEDPTLRALMPFFERRFVQTQVIIADGSTVVMGGLVDETTETFRDQVPFLGDIPYLGRLFRSEGSRTAKKNLTIFVKATQVDAHGLTRADRELARQYTQ